MIFNITDRKLITYILSELNTEPCNGSGYDPDGNSARAILTRRRDSYFKSLKWSNKELLGDLKWGLSEVGLDMSIGEALVLIGYCVFMPVIPFLREYFVVRKAVSEYKRQYLSEM